MIWIVIKETHSTAGPPMKGNPESPQTRTHTVRLCLNRGLQVPYWSMHFIFFIPSRRVLFQVLSSICREPTPARNCMCWQQWSRAMWQEVSFLKSDKCYPCTGQSLILSSSQEKMWYCQAFFLHWWQFTGRRNDAGHHLALRLLFQHKC